MIDVVQLEFPVAPMKATLGRLPAGDGWAYEIKWDGYRTLVFADGRTRLQSTSGRDVTQRWPEVGAISDAVNAGAGILDAELVVLDDVSSALDVETELLLWENLAEAGMTVIAVSHRAVAFERADQVLRLERGRLTDPLPPEQAGGGRPLAP